MFKVHSLTLQSVDATISFPSGLTISWAGKPIGQVAMSDISVTGDIGGIIDAETTFQIADLAHLTEFTKVNDLAIWKPGASDYSPEPPHNRII